jgi:sulfhydrogenase subunit beta (sulfur reductase)
MRTVFISELKSFLDAVAEQTELYVPKKSGDYFIYTKYDGLAEQEMKVNNIRSCATVKEFLFPVCEIASVYPQAAESDEVKPFAVFGLKNCDLASMEILDKVFLEEDFEDQLYKNRRENMFVIASDCFEPGENCFCNLLGIKPFAENGFDLNVSKIQSGYIVESGSEKGEEFLEKHSQLFTDVPDGLLAERNENRAKVQMEVEQNSADFKPDTQLRDIVESSQDSAIFDADADGCVECQACTRVCPTCHCFYLYDTKRRDYFAKMKMWDSCIRQAYAEVAGGENPRKILGDRINHRFMHKFVYFRDRYGIDMCVGCGRCVDACIGTGDTRKLLKKMSEELEMKTKKK